MFNTALAKSQYEQGGTPREEGGQLALRTSTGNMQVVRADGQQLAVPGRPTPPPPGGGMVARPQGMPMQHAGLASQDPAVQKHMQQAGKGDARYAESTLLLRQMKMAEALGGAIGVSVNMDDNSTQGSWMNLVRKKGPLICKMENSQWEQLTFFCYNGFFAACHLGGEEDVHLRTLNVTQVALSNFGPNPLPLPLQGCKIFALEGTADFSLQFPLPQHQGQPLQRKHLDLKAESNEVREQWLEEIYKATHLKQVAQDEEYVPHSIRTKSPAEQIAASQEVMPSRIDKFKEVVGNSYALVQEKASGGGRACMDAGNDCVIM